MCYAYLFDISSTARVTDSVWFDRGWTLQELLAPKKVVFFDRNWDKIGTKRSLADKIERRTGIDKIWITGTDEILKTNVSVAAVMSWASRRQTTRVEDRAYSLLGLFDVNMPLLYGEGPKAFIRLQEEIIRLSNDQSIFLWEGNLLRTNTMMATSPDNFADYRDSQVSGLGFTTTKHTLTIHCRLIHYTSTIYIAVISSALNASTRKDFHIGLFLECDYGSKVDTDFVSVIVDGKRCFCGTMKPVPVYQEVMKQINIRTWLRSGEDFSRHTTNDLRKGVLLDPSFKPMFDHESWKKDVVDTYSLLPQNGPRMKAEQLLPQDIVVFKVDREHGSKYGPFDRLTPFDSWTLPCIIYTMGNRIAISLCGIDCIKGGPTLLILFADAVNQSSDDIKKAFSSPCTKLFYDDRRISNCPKGLGIGRRIYRDRPFTSSRMNDKKLSIYKVHSAQRNVLPDLYALTITEWLEDASDSLDEFDRPSDDER